MIATMRPPIRRWNSWYWDLPIAAVAGMIAIVLLEANEPLFLGFNRLSNYTGTGFWAAVTILGDALIALTLLLPAVWRWPELVWSGVLAGLLAALFVHGFKDPFNVPRPASILPVSEFHIIGQTFLTRSFPSGHTATAFVVVGIMLLRLSTGWRRALAGPLLGLAGLVGLSRIVVGAHWPLDVLAGAVVGWLAAVLGTAGAQRWPWGSTPTGRRWLTCLLVGCALVVLVYYQTGYPQADNWRRILALLGLVSVGLQLWWERRQTVRSSLGPDR